MREPFSFGEFDPGAFSSLARRVSLVLSTALVAFLVAEAFLATGA